MRTVKKALPASLLIFFAFIILFVSILKSASTKTKFSSPSTTNPEDVRQILDKNIDYEYVYPGSVLPGHPLWPLKALRDRIWLLVTTGSSEKADLYLLFADKRLGGGVKLFEEGEYELGYFSLERSGIYLQQAADLVRKMEQQPGEVVSQEFLLRLYATSKGHKETLDDLLMVAPEDARPAVIKVQDHSKSAFNVATQALRDKGITPPVTELD